MTFLERLVGDEPGEVMGRNAVRKFSVGSLTLYKREMG